MLFTLFICGMPGSGKSKFGKRLSNRLLWNFIDLDQFIEEESGSSPAEIIQSQGESEFRIIESACLRKIQPEVLTIVSCGGGTPCFNDNLNWMKQQGELAFIDLPLATLKQRLTQSSDLEKRPLLGNSESDLQSNLEILWKSREPFYRQITWWIDGLKINLSEIELEVRSRF